MHSNIVLLSVFLNILLLKRQTVSIAEKIQNKNIFPLIKFWEYFNLSRLSFIRLTKDQNKSSWYFSLLSLILYYFVFSRSFHRNSKIVGFYKNTSSINGKQFDTNMSDVIGMTHYINCLGDGLSHTELRSQKCI